jgi:predicted small lipoprotein YifL
VRRVGLLAALLALAGCGGSDPATVEPAATSAPEASSPAPAAETGEIRDLANVLALRSDFEADAGKQRVLLLLSPT